MTCRRQVEALCIISVACVIVVGTVCLVVRQRNHYLRNKVPGDSPACNVSLLFDTSLDPLMAMSSSADWEKSETEPPATPDYTKWASEPYSERNCKCVRKCCQKGYNYDSNWKCKPSKSKVFKMYSDKMCPIKYDVAPESVLIKNILYNYNCPGTVSRWFSVLKAENFKSDSRLSQIDESLFCLESVILEDAIYIMKCNDLPLWFFKLRAFGHSVSAIFSVISILLYSLHPGLHNLKGKTLLCYMACLLIAQVTIPIHETDLFTNNHPISCKILAFIVQVSSLASAFWLNILCFDIWWIFSATMQPQFQPKDRERKIFLLYSCYAWGGTALITTIATIMDLLPDDSPYYIRPKFGNLDCWFNDEYARVLYYELPIGVLLCLNLLMFVTTAYRLRTAKVGGSKQGSRENNQRFVLFLKLFLAMGLYWLLDIVSPLLGKYRYLWMVPNIVATFQGIFVFIVVINNRRTSQYIRNRISTTQTSSV